MLLRVKEHDFPMGPFTNDVSSGEEKKKGGGGG